MQDLYFVQNQFAMWESGKKGIVLLCISWVESIQDFLIKLDIKPCMHFVEITILTKSCHCQTYQNYEQSRQKLSTILGNNVS